MPRQRWRRWHQRCVAPMHAKPTWRDRQAPGSRFPATWSLVCLPSLYPGIWHSSGTCCLGINMVDASLWQNTWELGLSHGLGTGHHGLCGQHLMHALAIAADQAVGLMSSMWGKKCNQGLQHRLLQCVLARRALDIRARVCITLLLSFCGWL